MLRPTSPTEPEALPNPEGARLAASGGVRIAIALGCLSGCVADGTSGGPAVWYGVGISVCQLAPPSVDVVVSIDRALEGDPALAPALDELEREIVDPERHPGLVPASEVRVETVLADGDFFDAAEPALDAVLADPAVTIAVLVLAERDDESRVRPDEFAAELVARVGDARSVVAGVLAPEGSERLGAFADAVSRAGGRAVVSPIGNLGSAAPLADVAVAIRETLARASACLTEPLRRPDGAPYASGEHVDCVIRETTSLGCGRGTFPTGLDPDGFETCQFCQTGDTTLDFQGTDVSRCAGDPQAWRYSTEIRGCEGSGFFEWPPGFVFDDGAILQAACLSHLDAPR